MDTTVEEVSLSTMKLTIKIPPESVELAISNALVLMREVRDCLKEEGNYIGHLFTPKNLSPIIIKKKPSLLSKRTVSWNEILAAAVSPIAIQYSPNAKQDSPNAKQDSPTGKKVSPNCEQVSPIARLFSTFSLSSKTPKGTFEI